MPAKTQTTSKVTWLVGHGDLFQSIAARLRDTEVRVVRDLDEAELTQGDRVVLAVEGWDPDEALATQQGILERGASLLPARVVGDLGIVGPWVHADRPGCQICAERRRRLWRRQTSPKEPLSDTIPAMPVTVVHLEHIADIVHEALAANLVHECQVHVTRGDLVGEVHRIVPIPTCPGCTALPDDSAHLARLDWEAQIQHDPEAFRTNSQGLLGGALRDQLHDWRYGPVGHVFRSENSAGALVSAELALLTGTAGEGGYGRAATYPRAETIALYEAAERLASSSPHNKRTVVRGAQRDLPDALDLREVGLHDPTLLDHPLFRFQPYDPSVSTDWVWSWQLNAQRPVLVPEHLAYWHIDPWGRAPVGPRFLYESSNGAAIGSTVEEAVLYGLLEVIERDAFLMCWYSKRPARRLIVDEEVPELRGLRGILAPLGYTLHLFDVTTEIGVPSVMSLVVRDDDDGPVAFFAAGAHCDPRRAVASAASEAVTNAVLRVRTDPATRIEFESTARRLLDDLTQTRTLREHTALYNLPETRDWWSFLDLRSPGSTLTEAFGDWRAKWLRHDLTDSLRAVLATCDAAGLDPLVVDQTDRSTPGAPSTVKVLVPQTLPMTFGHVNRRTEHLHRLQTVPVLLGYRDHDAPPVDPATSPPHPFP